MRRPILASLLVLGLGVEAAPAVPQAPPPEPSHVEALVVAGTKNSIIESGTCQDLRGSGSQGVVGAAIRFHPERGIGGGVEVSLARRCARQAFHVLPSPAERDVPRRPRPRSRQVGTAVPRVWRGDRPPRSALPVVAIRGDSARACRGRWRARAPCATPRPLSRISHGEGPRALRAVLGRSRFHGALVSRCHVTPTKSQFGKWRQSRANQRPTVGSRFGDSATAFVVP